MIFDRRILRLGAAALSVTIFGGSAVALCVFPAAAAGAIAAVTTVTCSVSGANWCISGNNTGSGIGVIGTSKTGTGLRGTSTSQNGLKATSVSGNAIVAQTKSGPAAVYATGGTYGVYGLTAQAGGVGVAGLISGTGGGDGVYGYSSSGSGVYAQSDSGSALYATNATENLPALHAVSNVGVAGQFDGGVHARTFGFGLVVSGDYPIWASATASHNSAVFSVDNAGNVTYSGSLSNSAKTTGGATVNSFGANSTRPTIEDTGTAQLVGGSAAVRLDPAFAASIDMPGGYRVFVTPNGDTNGLFVATKTPSGFVVRESRGGRSTVAFDYRIIATAAGKGTQRMAFSAKNAPTPVVRNAPPPAMTVPPAPPQR